MKLLSSNSYRKMQSLLLKGTPATKFLFGTINFSAFTPVCRTLIAYISYGKVSTRLITINVFRLEILNLKSTLDLFI